MCETVCIEKSMRHIKIYGAFTWNQYCERLLMLKARRQIRLEAIASIEGN